MDAMQLQKAAVKYLEGKGYEVSGATPLEERVKWWRARGDVGVSSETIWGALAGCPVVRADAPHDPEDFGRCKALLDLIPEWKPELVKVALVYPWYAPFLDRWDDMERLYISAKYPELYDLMQILEVESTRLRHPGG